VKQKKILDKYIGSKLGIAHKQILTSLNTTLENITFNNLINLTKRFTELAFVCCAC
jgi:hypothetical protein